MAKRCFEELRKSFGDRFDEKTANRIISDLETIEGLAKGAPDGRSFRKMSYDYFKDNQILTRSQLKTRTTNIVKGRERMGSYLDMRLKDIPFAKAIKAKLSRFAFAGEGAQLNADSMYRGMLDNYHGTLYTGLIKQGKDVLDFFKGRVDEKSIAIELEQLHLNNGEVGKSGNTLAVKTAKAVYAMQNKAFKDMRAAGMDIHKLEGRFVRQAWDAKKLMGDGISKDEAFVKFKDAVLPHLDHEKTFKLDHVDDAGKEEFLRGAFDDIINGKNEIADGHGLSDELLLINKKAADMAEKATRSRKIHFKSAESWFEVNSQFGKQSLVDSLLSETQKNARTTALVNIFGTNPEAALNADIARARSIIKRIGSEKELAEFDAEVNGSRGVLSLYKTLTGANEQGFDNGWAQAGHFARATQNMLRLGLATLGSLPDIGTSASILSAKTGKSFLGAHLEVISGIFGSDPATRVRNAEFFGTAMEDMIGDISSKFDLDGDIPGRMSDIQRKYFKLTGLSQWTARVKSSVTMTFAKELGMNSKLGMNDVNPRIKATLERYGINSDEWDIIRANTQNVNGKPMITADSVGDSPELRFKLLNLYHDIGGLGSPTGSARIKNLFLGDTRADDPIGQVYRFMAQFKTFGASMYDVTFSVANSDPTREITKLRDIFKLRGDWQHTMGMAVSLTALGYASEVARSVAKGETPPEPNNVDTFIKSMVRGGALGLLGDLAFSESRKYGGGALKDIAGPVSGEFVRMLEDTQDTFDEIIHNKASYEKIGKRMFKTLERNTVPNLPLIKPTIQYLFMNSIHESLNPGYLRNKEKRLRERGQKTFLPVNEEAF